MADFAINCFCNCPGDASAGGGQNEIVVTGGDLTIWRAAAAAGQFTGIVCPNCGCTQDLVDTGTAVGTADTAAPRVDSIDVGTGPAAGGTAVTLTGHRLNTAGLVVKFDGVAATGLRTQSDTHCTVDTPAHVAATVDVTVENSNGQRLNGGALAGAFVYT